MIPKVIVGLKGLNSIITFDLRRKIKTTIKTSFIHVQKCKI